jgi:hypothetical protein
MPARLLPCLFGNRAVSRLALTFPQRREKKESLFPDHYFHEVKIKKE